MQMKLTHYIYLSTALAMLTACGEDIDPVYTVGEADNAIIFMAGVSDGGQAKTRADENLHVPFASQTQLRLYVEGNWTKKDASTSTVTQYTNCSTGTANEKLDGSVNDIHPLESYSPTLYWDDYGTADPANIDNRSKGLAVFGVGVEGLSSLPNELSSLSAESWTNLSWSVKTDGASVLSKDLVVSKNLGDNSAPEKTGLKFDKRKSTTVKTDNLLIFEHMMSKVTFILNAGAGFDNGVFKSAPEVILTRNKHGETSETEYCYTSGTVNIKTTDVTGTTLSTVKTQVTNNNLTGTELSSVEEQALIFPGSDFGSSDEDIVARIKADDNIYYVSAKMIRAKLDEMYSSEVTSTRYKTKKGVNYVITVIINKTDISVTASVKEWTIVNAAEESPVIDVNNVWGGEELGETPEFTSFSFYRSTSLNSGYSTIKSTLKEGNYYKPEATVTKNTSGNWVFDTPLYWPNHLTHFQFRGVYPLTTTESEATKPRVETENDIQVIKVWNVAYVAESFPSDLMIARPDVSEDAVCTNKEPGHTETNLYSGGICATEGSINMHFNYMMSQVEVNLRTTSDDKKVNLTGAKVELVNVYNTGNVKLGDREAVVTGTAGTYELNTVTGSNDKRLSAIVPQELTYSSKGAETNLRFKVTIYNTETTTQVDDVYYADVKPILKKNTTTGELIAPSGKWEAGQRYVYELVLTKTQIEVTASLKDWDEVEASENIWF